VKLDKHLRPPSFAVPTTPEASTSFVLPPGPIRPASQDQLSTRARPQLSVEPPVDRVVRPSKSRENLSISSWPRPPTVIPLSPSHSPTRSSSRAMTTPPPTIPLPPTPTSLVGNRDSYYDFVRQPSPTFAKMTITNRDRAYTFGTPSLPSATPPPPSPPPPSRVTSPLQNQGITRVGSVVGGNAHGSVEVNVISPSVSSFINSPSIYSTYSGNEPHPASAMYMSTVKGTV
jgi:hypothetical protein